MKLTWIFSNLNDETQQKDLELGFQQPFSQNLDNPPPRADTTGTALVDQTASRFSVKEVRTWFGDGWSWEKEEEEEKEGLFKIKTRNVDNYPKGFPKLACYMDSDDAFMIYRRFGGVFSRLLLWKQDRISRMEDLSLRMDKTDDSNAETRKYLMSHERDARRDGNPQGCDVSRPQLFKELKTEVLDYADLLLKHHQLKALNPPSRKDHQSVKNFLENGDENNMTQLPGRESRFICEKEDLVSLRPGREHAWLDGLVETCIQKFDNPLTRYIYTTESTRQKTKDPDIHYTDRDRVRMTVTCLITLVILALLIAPIVALYELALHQVIYTSAYAIGIIFVCTLVFAAVVSAFMNAKRHELLAASAGYSAVLVVFLGNVNSH